MEVIWNLEPSTHKGQWWNEIWSRAKTAKGGKKIWKPGTKDWQQRKKTNGTMEQPPGWKWRKQKTVTTHPSVLAIFLDCLSLKMGPTGCPEMPVAICRPNPRHCLHVQGVSKMPGQSPRVLYIKSKIINPIQLFCILNNKMH